MVAILVCFIGICCEVSLVSCMDPVMRFVDSLSSEVSLTKTFLCSSFILIKPLFIVKNKMFLIYLEGGRSIYLLLVYFVLKVHNHFMFVPFPFILL